MLNTIIKLKNNNFSLFVLYIFSSIPKLVRKAIKDKIKQSPNILIKNIPVIINIESINYDFNWDEMKCAIISTGLKIIGIDGCKNETLKYKILNSGIPLISNKNKKSIFKRKETSKIIYSQVRSGQKIYSYNSDLIIINNVNSGAELISDYNIHIYGKMYGRALAGARGNIKCQIFCSFLYAELISIAGEYWSIDKIPSLYHGKSVRFFLKNKLLNIKKIK